MSQKRALYDALEGKVIAVKVFAIQSICGTKVSRDKVFAVHRNLRGKQIINPHHRYGIQ